jgi:hypothetical protein
MLFGGQETDDALLEGVKVQEKLTCSFGEKLLTFSVKQFKLGRNLRFGKAGLENISE